MGGDPSQPAAGRGGGSGCGHVLVALDFYRRVQKADRLRVAKAFSHIPGRLAEGIDGLEIRAIDQQQTYNLHIADTGRRHEWRHAITVLDVDVHPVLE